MAKGESKTGNCRFCGQSSIIEGGADMTAPQLEEAATMQCTCEKAMAYQETANRRTVAKQRAEELFGKTLESMHSRTIRWHTFWQELTKYVTKKQSRSLLLSKRAYAQESCRWQRIRLRQFARRPTQTSSHSKPYSRNLTAYHSRHDPQPTQKRRMEKKNAARNCNSERRTVQTI